MLAKNIFRPLIQTRTRLSCHTVRFNHDGSETRAVLGDIQLKGVHLDEIDQLMTDAAIDDHNYYPNLDIQPSSHRVPTGAHNLAVIQPWKTYHNFDGQTDPELQLEECVSLGNTLKGWRVVAKKILFTNDLNKKHLVGPSRFEALKEEILAIEGVSAVFFGVELLSGVQLSTLEKELNLACYDRFTMVLNIFRQHAKTKEAKIQLALAELPYIRSHLREIHDSSEYSSTSNSLKMLIGGSSQTIYHKRLQALLKREKALRAALVSLRKQREITKKLRIAKQIPIVSVVGYTNSGKTSLIKYLTGDDKITPEDKLFATLDVTTHLGHLPSCRDVFYLDTVGFISRVPVDLIEAFKATLDEVRDSKLILHILDVTHPDHVLQYATVIKALETLKVATPLIRSMITIGNKIDKLSGTELPKTLPNRDIDISVTTNQNLKELASMINQRLTRNIQHNLITVRIPNGGESWQYLRKRCSFVTVEPDPDDANFLVCRVLMSGEIYGQYKKRWGEGTIVLSEKLVSSGELNDLDKPDSQVSKQGDDGYGAERRSQDDDAYR